MENKECMPHCVEGPTTKITPLHIGEKEKEKKAKPRGKKQPATHGELLRKREVSKIYRGDCQL